MTEDRKERSGTVMHTVRTKDGGRKTLPMGRKLAMAAMCTECMGWDNPAGCTSPLCPLFPFRMKTERTLKGEVTNE